MIVRKWASGQKNVVPVGCCAVACEKDRNREIKYWKWDCCFWPLQMEWRGKGQGGLKRYQKKMENTRENKLPTNISPPLTSTHQIDKSYFEIVRASEVYTHKAHCLLATFSQRYFLTHHRIRMRNFSLHFKWKTQKILCVKLQAQNDGNKETKACWNQPGLMDGEWQGVLCILLKWRKRIRMSEWWEIEKDAAHTYQEERANVCEWVYWRNTKGEKENMRCGCVAMRCADEYDTHIHTYTYNGIRSVTQFYLSPRGACARERLPAPLCKSTQPMGNI